ncbi:MAG: universal stress protein [Polyangiaceae bacterium]|nr:universal stress protein [Polyangiaceae bacterium]MCW5789382.1 universal stress protein [Polyangiaceae bacterium]
MSGVRPEQVTWVVGLDYSELGDLAFDRALALAAERPGVELHVIQVASGYGPMVSVEVRDDTLTLTLEEASARLKQHVQQRLSAYEERLGPLQLGRLVTHVRVGSPAQEIAQLATDLRAEQVVVGTHGRRGFSRLLLGSVAEGVVRLAPCSVMVVRPPNGAPEPKLEPPCSECAALRERSGGESLWCPEHRQRYGRIHTYNYTARTWSEPPSSAE